MANVPADNPAQGRMVPIACLSILEKRKYLSPASIQLSTVCVLTAVPDIGADCRNCMTVITCGQRLLCMGSSSAVQNSALHGNMSEGEPVSDWPVCSWNCVAVCPDRRLPVPWMQSDRQQALLIGLIGSYSRDGLEMAGVCGATAGHICCLVQQSASITWCATAVYRYSITWCATAVCKYSITWCATAVCKYSITWCATAVCKYSITWCATAEYEACKLKPIAL
jgi:hypothetical protein